MTIEDVRYYLQSSGFSEEQMDTIEQAFKQEPKWIPVSERLPEKNMPCLVSAGKLCLTQIAIYSDLMGTIDHRIFYQGDYGHENFVDITQYVIAWMPLPKPYKAESEIHCNCTDAEIAKSFIEDVEAVKDLLPQESEE